ncbi:MAG: MarR family transcriptional regulator [Chitinophagales bacterium]
MNIEQAIQQRHFKSEYQKAHINILFTAAWLSQEVTQSLKEYDITWQQFNILRIIKGQHPKAVTVKLLQKRMIDKMSNASRLVEKLRKKNLVIRQECPKDRRRVDIVLTAEGMTLLELASAAIDEHLTQHLQNLSIEEAQTLNGLLDKMRGTSGE